MKSGDPFVVGVGGFSSNVGKTTLMCELLRSLPGWEAIKTTRGHYRSCGKDPHTCCVSDLLGNEATIRSGRNATYQEGKDTGRYWEAGAANVHWVIATDDQVSAGIKEAISRVKSAGVLIEGNSFSEYVKVDLMLMVSSGEEQAVKRSARSALKRCFGIYLSTGQGQLDVPHNTTQVLKHSLAPLTVFRREDLPELVRKIRSSSTEPPPPHVS